MNFQQLNYIVAVAEHQNFNRAALACDVAQSTLSKEIQRLEQEYEILIFDRTRNPVVPTMKGQELIAKAREILSLRKEFVQIAEQRQNAVAGKITLAITEILAPYLSPLFLHTMAQKYPLLELKVLELSDRRTEDMLGQEKVDAAIMVAPALQTHYYEHKLWEEDFLLYSSEALSQSMPGTVDREQVTFASVYLQEDLREILKRNFPELGEALNQEPSSKIQFLKGNLESIRNIVEYNGGTMLLPRLAETFIQTSASHALYAIAQPLILQVSLIAGRGFEKNRIIKHLVRELGEIA